MIPRNTQMAFVTQNKHDFDVLKELCREKQWGVPIVEFSHRKLEDFQPPLSREQVSSLDNALRLLQCHSSTRPDFNIGSRT